MGKTYLFLVLFFVFCCCSNALAVSADPEPRITTQPDGTHIKIQIKGDEFQNWYELAGTGYTILPNQKTGYWEYAVQNPDGTLSSSGIQVDNDGKNAPSFVINGIRPERNLTNEGLMNAMLQDMQMQRQSALLSTGSSGLQLAWTQSPASGTKNVLIILVNFADRAFITTPVGWYNKVFNLGDKSVARFYRDNSSGVLSVTPVNHTQAGNPPGIVSVSVADNHPNSGGNSNYATESAIINHALTQAGYYVNFALYDTNGDGTIDSSEMCIYFVYAGYEASGSSLSPNIWAHAWGGPGVSAAGKTVTHWALNGELNNSSMQHPMGVIAHELGHSMCGLPDLYDTTYTNAGLGHFSLMAGGSWGYDASSGEYNGGLTPVSLDAWSREYLGWTTPKEPVSPSTVSLEGVLTGSDAAYRFIDRTVSTMEYFLLENRRPFGWDLGLTGLLGTSWPGGMLILHIDSNVGTVGTNTINRYVATGHQGVVPVQASVTSCNMLTSSCRGDSTTLFYYGNNNAWTPTTVPDTNYYSGVSSTIFLDSISAPGSVMTGVYSSAAPPVYSISGTVHAGSVTGPGLAGATVVMAGVTATTSATGSFTLNGIPAGTYALSISASGYAPGMNAAYVVTGGQSGVDFYLLVSAVALSEGFETVTPSALPGNWLSSTDTELGVWSTNVGTVHPAGGGSHSGANLVYFNSWTALPGDTATLISPSFSLNGISGGQVKFQMYRDAAYATTADRVEVYVNTTGNLSGASLLGVINRSVSLSPVVTAAGWYEYSFDIPDVFNGLTTFLIFNGISMYGNDIHLDDISVSGAAVTVPVITGISPTSIVQGIATDVTITGANFLHADVTFSNGSVGTVASNDSTSIIVPVTGTTTGSGTVAVTTANGSSRIMLKVSSGKIYNVIFDSNGGSTVASQSVPDSGFASLPSPPVKTGYTFAGWYSDSGLTTVFYFTTPVNVNTILYAKWTINTYTVTFNSNGGSPVTSQIVTYNATATMPVVPTRSGYSFGGWFSDAALTTVFDFATPITAGVNLYAGWTIIPLYTISGIIHAGTLTGPGLADATVVIGGVTVTTTATGSFVLSGIPTGTFAMQISAPGYAPYTDAAYVVTGDQAFVEFYLLESSVILGENFDTVIAPSLPDNWFSTAVTGYYTWKSNGGTTHPMGGGAHSGFNLVCFNSYTAPSGNTSTLVSPSFSLTRFMSGQVKFWMYRDAGYPAAADRVEVYVNTTGSLTGATLLGTINRSRTLSPAVATTGWYEYSFDIPTTFNGDINYLIFNGVSMYGNDIYLDDISVSGPPVLVPTLTGISPAKIVKGVETEVTLTGTNLLKVTVSYSNGTVGNLISTTDTQLVIPIIGTTLGAGLVTVTTANDSVTFPLKVINASNYTVTFDSNGGSTVVSQTVPDGSFVIKPPNPLKTGYTFAGWYSDRCLTTPFDFTPALDADITLYARWTINSYPLTITLVGTGTVSGFTTGVPASISFTTGGSSFLTYGTVVTLVPNPTAIPANGVLFSGWSGACNGKGDNANNNACTFTVTAATSVTANFISSPTLASFTPAAGVAGTQVTLTGTYLDGTNSVTFNGSAATAVTQISATSITAIVPAGATTGPISVTTPGGTATSASVYTVVPPAPTITALAPASVVVGDALTLTGTNLATATAVAFSGIPVTTFTVVSASQITTTVPLGATTGKVTVTTPGGTATSTDSITVIDPPVISGFTPLSGVAGTTVTLTGTNLAGATSVMFNGVVSTAVTLISATSLTAIVPTGALPGPISVTTVAGTGTSAGVYTVISPPTITSFTPLSGVAGTTVTLTGTNLTGATTVMFNGVVSTAVTMISATTLAAIVPIGALPGPISVTTVAGTGTSAGVYTVISPPTISSFTPLSGVVGTMVTLTGTNLSGVTSVTFNGIASTAVTLISATSISATVPSGATPGPVRVTTAAGTATSTTVYTVTAPAPTVTALAPTSGIVGAAVTLTGTNLTTATAVAFNGVSVAAFTVVSATQITTTVPVGTTTGKITVTTLGGTATSASSFTVIGPPTITSFTPTSGVVGTKVTLTGTNLGGATSVTFNGVASTAVTLTSATSISATVPTGATPGPVIVTTAAGTATSTTVYTVTAPAPTVTAVSPTSGIVGAAVTLTGTNFTTATAVAFNGVAVAAFTVVSATQITTTIPVGATTGKITVTTLGGTATSASSFTVIGPPTITSFTPTSGVVGTVVTLTGTNLGSATSVTFNGVAATAVTLTSATSIKATVPSGATTGTISVTTAAGTGTSATAYTVTVPAPTVTAFSPTSGIVGAVVTLTGTNLTNTSAVAFNGVAVAAFTVVSATQITATIPAGATTGKITVTTLGGTATSAGSFTVIGPPTITSFTPTSGVVGTVVTLTGTNLGSATSVTFNGVAATAVTLTSATSIKATVPSGASTGTISVTTAAGTGTSATAYTVTVPAPTVTALAPTSGIVGAVVTLTGTNLTNASAVAFNGVAGVAFTVVSATQITATIPAGATTGKVTVTTLGGTATSASSFTVIGPPTITSFTPTSGVVGTVVTLTGTNLGSATSVTFNGVAATAVTLTSATSIKATVPSGATTGTISVTTAAGTGMSATAYTVTIPVPTVTTLSPATGGIGASVTLTGTNFTGATKVLFIGATGTVPVSVPFTVISATSILTAVPVGATTGKISVTTPGGTGTSTASFAVSSAVVLPVITSFTPTSGAAGTVVTITGTNLAGGTAATVGTASAVVKALSATSLSITVPAGAVAGAVKLSVTTPGGTVNSTGTFTVL